MQEHYEFLSETDRHKMLPPVTLNRLVQRYLDDPSSIPPAIQKRADETYSWAIVCQYDADDELRNFDFWRQVGVEGLEGTLGFEALCEHCGMVWCMEGFVIMTNKPEQSFFDSKGYLHCADGAALRFVAGYGIYCWHGTQVPKQALLHPETITDKEIAAADDKTALALCALRSNTDLKHHTPSTPPKGAN